MKELGNIVIEIYNKHKTSNKNRNRMIESILWEFAKEVKKEYKLKIGVLDGKKTD